MSKRLVLSALAQFIAKTAGRNRVFRHDGFRTELVGETTQEVSL